MSAEDQNIPSVAAINKQLVELRRDLGRVAVESGSTNSQAVKAVQARIAELTAQLQEAEAARERSVPPPLNPTSTLQALERLGRNAMPKRVQQHLDEVAGRMKADGSAYQRMANDLYSLGHYLAHYKYPYLRWAYIFLLSGFVVAGLTELGMVLFR